MGLPGLGDVRRGATPSWEFALAGLDQDSGGQLDTIMWGDQPFTGPLRQAYDDGKISKERLPDMVGRILRSMFAVGVDTWGEPPEVVMAAHNEIRAGDGAAGIVLLKNDGALPLATDQPLKIGVVGGYAQLGVPSGAGSGAVLPDGGFAAVISIGGQGPMDASHNLFLMPSSPLVELKTLVPNAEIDYDPAQTAAGAAHRGTRERAASCARHRPLPRHERTVV